jgi:hypothetical protein
MHGLPGGDDCIKMLSGHSRNSYDVAAFGVTRSYRIPSLAYRDTPIGVQFENDRDPRVDAVNMHGQMVTRKERETNAAETKRAQE